MIKLKTFIIILGIMCMIYLLILFIYAGLGASFSSFWLFAGLSCFGIVWLIDAAERKQIILFSHSKVLLVGILVIGFFLFFLLEGVLLYHAAKEPRPDADYMIVLGARIKGTTITRSLKKRLDTAKEYADKNDKTVVIVSGGQGPGEDISEALAMKQYLLDKGLDVDRIRMEDTSTNTTENIAFSKLIIRKEHGNNIEDIKTVIVSNGFHIFRATSIAKKQNFGIVMGLGAPSDKIMLIHYYVREAAAVVKDITAGNMRLFR